MKGIYLLFFLLLININCLLIRAQEIENATLLTVSQLETTYRIKDYPIVYYLASRDYKTVEYFELKDTLFRDTLLFFIKNTPLTLFSLKKLIILVVLIYLKLILTNGEKKSSSFSPLSTCIRWEPTNRLTTLYFK